MVRTCIYSCYICGKQDEFKNFVVAHRPADSNGYCVIDTYCEDCYGETSVKKSDDKHCLVCDKKINVDKDECVVVTKPGKRTDAGSVDVFCLNCYLEYINGRGKHNK